MILGIIGNVLLDFQHINDKKNTCYMKLISN